MVHETTKFKIPSWEANISLDRPKQSLYSLKREGSLPYPQKSASSPYTEPHKSIPHTPFRYLEDTF
jgi:hypothetical protein